MKTIRDWKAVLQRLLDAGYNYNTLGAICEVVPATMRHLHQGRTTDPAYSLGDTLVQLIDRLDKGLPLVTVTIETRIVALDAAPPAPPAQMSAAGVPA